MGSVSFSNPTMVMADFNYIRHLKVHNCYMGSLKIGHMGKVIHNLQPAFPSKHNLQFSGIPRLLSSSSAQYNGEGDLEEYPVEHLRVPRHWLDPARASEVNLFMYLFIFRVSLLRLNVLCGNLLDAKFLIYYKSYIGANLGG